MKKRKQVIKYCKRYKDRYKDIKTEKYNNKNR